MNRPIIYIVSLVLLTMTASSCKKYLTLQPQDGIIRQEYWQTKEQVQSAVTGCYASLLGDLSGSGDRPLSDYLFMWGELRGDMLYPGLGVSNDETDVMNVNTLPTNTVTKWSAVYRTINYCNTVIDFAPDVLKTDNTLSQSQLNAWLAEARGLRALMYFYLVRSFRDVPLKIKSTAGDNDLQLIAKSPADSVMAQVVSDLAFADNNIMLTYGSKVTDKGRLTKYTIKAIEADVFLWMEKYQQCVDACNFIINSANFGLIGGNNNWFYNLYYLGNSNESIFEFQFDVQKLNTFYNTFLTSKQRYLASPYVMEQVYTIDYVNGYIDIRGEGASVRTSDNAIWKYVAVDYNTARTADASYAHWFVYRYADILLMKAEALNWQGGHGQEALDLVTRIRNRAFALDATNMKPDPNDQNSLGDFILAERAREFSFEGKRWYDVLRNAKRNNYARIDILKSMVSHSASPQVQQSAMNKYSNPDSHYFPIYAYELQTDPNLIQNPFYK